VLVELVLSDLSVKQDYNTDMYMGTKSDLCNYHIVYCILFVSQLDVNYYIIHRILSR